MARQGTLPLLALATTLRSRSRLSRSCRQGGWHREQNQPQQPLNAPVKQLFNVPPPKSPPRSALSCHERRVACVAELRGQRVTAMAVGSPNLLLVFLKVVHAREKTRQCLVCQQRCSALTCTWSGGSCHKGVWT